MTKELIVVKDLHKNFGDLEVLKGIDQTIHQGEVVSIIDLVVQENRLSYVV